MPVNDTERAAAELDYWGARIERRALRLAKGGPDVHFDDLLGVDELKLLLAMARSGFAAWQAGRGPDRVGLQAEFVRARDELAAAMQM